LIISEAQYMALQRKCHPYPEMMTLENECLKMYETQVLLYYEEVFVKEREIGASL
jgi:hypothetical protein